MDTLGNLKDFDVYKDVVSGNLLLRPKKKPRTDFENSPLPSTSTYQTGTSNSSIIVGENETSMTDEMETSAANSHEMETSAQV